MMLHNNTGGIMTVRFFHCGDRFQSVPALTDRHNPAYVPHTYIDLHKHTAQCC